MNKKYYGSSREISETKSREKKSKNGNQSFKKIFIFKTFAHIYRI